eukprot:GILI01004294.1.p1 GENE.GILI01004294.1~~GILI01004294.1.p1  ORF type:complete len:526 (+),score=132.35 GILI01004294.1:1686-3263(+)
MSCCNNEDQTKDITKRNQSISHYQAPPMQYTAIAEIPAIITKARAAATSQLLFPVEQRKTVLKELMEFFTTNERKIFDVLKNDLGRSDHESYVVEVSQIMGELSTAHANVEKWAKPAAVKTGMNTLHMLDGLSIKPDPLGLVCIIAPWNYPFAMCFAPLAGAIAAGNIVVLKPSELTEGTASFLAEELPKYKSLGQYIHIINGAKDEVGEILKHKFDHIFYTGNGMVGRIVMAAAAPFLTPVTLELGGKSPVIIHESSKGYLEYAARRVLWGKFVNCGQTCVAPDYVLVPQSLEKDFIAALRKARDEFFALNGKEPNAVPTTPSAATEPVDSPAFKAIMSSTSYSRIVNGRHWKRIMDLTTADSGEIAIGGESDEATKFIAPTVLTNVKLDGPIMKDEIFGPLLPIIPYKNDSDVVSFINARDKPLALYIFSHSKTFTEDVLSRTSSGGVTINDVMMHVGSTYIPFGGVGESGMGRYHGKYSFDTFSHQRSIMHKSINGLGEKINGNSRYPPYTDSMTNLVRKLI